MLRPFIFTDFTFRDPCPSIFERSLERFALVSIDEHLRQIFIVSGQQFLHEDVLVALPDIPLAYGHQLYTPTRRMLVAVEFDRVFELRRGVGTHFPVVVAGAIVIQHHVFVPVVCEIGDEFVCQLSNRLWGKGINELQYAQYPRFFLGDTHRTHITEVHAER